MMLAGDWLRAAEALPETEDPRVVLGDGPALLLAPHPDDESLGCGGLIAAAADAGLPLRIQVISDGGGSHPRLPRDILRRLREAETRAAVAALGLPAAALGFMGLPDQAVPLAGPAFDRAVATLLAAGRPETILVTWQHDPHCDHAASFAIGAALARASGARLLAYPVWGLAHAWPDAGFPLPPEPRLDAPPRGHRFGMARWLPAKRAAIAAHASQMGQLPGGFTLPPELLALADRPFELLLDCTP
ncbi:MAG: PIG-L family deacetylase [Acetobacteraceae bacterium]|nr:MAG: PIG-L family deacetylase [Acetobacteraceae bacterium]